MELVSETPAGVRETVALPKVTGHREYDTASRKSQIVGFTDTGFEGKVRLVITLTFRERLVYLHWL